MSHAPPAAKVAAHTDLIAGRAESTQQSRQPDAGVVRALADDGLLRVLAPRSYGGAEATGAEFVELVEAVARIDGSAGWATMTLNEEIEIACAYLPVDTMTSVCSSDPALVVAGSGAVLGSAVRAHGGWRVSGRWPFVTGGPVADHIVLGAAVDGPKPRSICYVLVPADEVEILDTWDTAGLRGTGSHDVALDDVFVPDERAGPTPSVDQTVPDSVLFRLPASLRFPFPKVGVATGIARSAIVEFSELAQGKRANISRTLLRERADAQLAVAEAEALIESGWAYAMSQLDVLWNHALRSEAVPQATRARARLAAAHAVASCVTAVETLCTAAGTTSNFVSSPLQRALADVRAVSQHAMVGGFNKWSAGQALLGMQPSDPLF